MAQLASFGDGMQYLNGAGFWGLVSVVFMSIAKGGSLRDTTTLLKNPWRMGGWFLIGATVSVIVNSFRMREAGYNSRIFIMHKRVVENEQTHALLRNIR